MNKNWIWSLAKGLEGLGLVVVLVGVVWSMNAGFNEEGLESMKIESYALLFGGVMFLIGWLLERALGAR